MYFLIKVQLKGYRPPIWRRFLIPTNANFYDLHLQIQYAFNWDNDHLFMFFRGREELISGGPFGIDDEINNEGILEGDETLAEVLDIGDRLDYIFDFGDCWEHIVTVEKVFENKSDLPSRTIMKKGENVEQYPDWDEEEEDLD